MTPEGVGAAKLATGQGTVPGMLPRASCADQRCDKRDAKHAGVPLRRVRAGEVRCEEFLYELKAGPAGGRLRRPSSRRQRHDGRRGAGLTQHATGSRPSWVVMVAWRSRLVPSVGGEQLSLFPPATGLIEAIRPAAQVERYNRIWRMGQVRQRGPWISGRIGYETLGGPTQLWSEEIQDFEEVSLLEGRTSPFSVHVPTRHVAFQLRMPQ
jgi:hypothetical protein